MAKRTRSNVLTGKAQEVLNDPAKLRALYHGQQMSLGQIGAHLRCAQSTVRTYMVKHGIERRQSGVTGYKTRREVERELWQQGQWLPTWEARDARQRVRISWYRLHLLSGRCPDLCPQGGFCDDQPGPATGDGRTGCPLYNALKQLGELRPRPWEPDGDPFAYWQGRLPIPDDGRGTLL